MASIEELRSARISKLENLKKSGNYPYPARVKKTHNNFDLHEYFDTYINSVEPIFIAGRVKSLRLHGGSAFFDVEDDTGEFQVFIKKDRLGDEKYSLFESNIDVGDFVEASGHLFKTKQDSKTLEADDVKIIVKSIRPIPEEWYGLKDIEERLRHRYLDLILNKGVKENFRARSRIVSDLRKFLAKEGFMEVETPMLQPIPGGALAEPFKTHLNTLSIDLYLRVAPELYLKRLLVGGFEKIYEIGKCFRNEGIDYMHNPEFTMLELYWAYQDYKGLMKFVKKMLKKYVKGDWKTADFSKMFKEKTGKKYTDFNPEELDDIFKKEVRAKIEGPLFLMHYPESIMPLAKLKEDDPKLTESFQLIVNGAEVVKGFSEMNDPVIQRDQMERQERAFREGNKESSRLDENFLEALEYGMPPTAGLGIGIDRLSAIIGGHNSIRDVIFFPFMKDRN